MSDREKYAPGPAAGAEVRKDGDKWTLIVVRELRHSPAKVWQALTDPEHLREWASSIPIRTSVPLEPPIGRSRLPLLGLFCRSMGQREGVEGLSSGR